jgi:glycosyltransferase involved in cell wall biosynthesis
VYDVVMLVLNDVAYDSRVRKEAAALAAAGWRVLVVGTQRGEGRLPDHEHVAGFELRRVRYARFGAAKWRPWRWMRHGLQALQIVRALLRIDARAYHAHDFPALIVLSLLRGLCRGPVRLVYDAHELYLFLPMYTSRGVQAWHRLTRPLFMRLEGWLARRADGMLVPDEVRARLLARWYRVPRPVVIQNAADPVTGDEIAPVDLRALVGTNRRCVVHTGDITNRGRALTELVAAMARLPDDVALVLLGQGEDAEAVLAQAERLDMARRVFVVPPVPPDQVAATVRTADVAAVLTRQQAWNTRAGPPNKLYEAIAAGLPLVASDTFVLRRVVRGYGLGVVCDHRDPAAIAMALLAVLDRADTYREQVRAAQQVFNWQHEADKLRSFYRGILAME